MSIVTLDKKKSSQCIMFVRYLTSIIALEKIVAPLCYVCPIFDVDYCTREICRAMYYVRPTFDVDYYTEEDCRANVLC